MQCNLCQENIEYVDYKNTKSLRQFVTAQFKIGTSRRNGLCARHQRMIANGIKVARHMALMPFTRNQTVRP